MHLGDWKHRCGWIGCVGCYNWFWKRSSWRVFVGFYHINSRNCFHPSNVTLSYVVEDHVMLCSVMLFVQDITCSIIYIYITCASIGWHVMSFHSNMSKIIRISQKTRGLLKRLAFPRPPHSMLGFVFFGDVFTDGSKVHITIKSQFLQFWDNMFYLFSNHLM